MDTVLLWCYSNILIMEENFIPYGPFLEEWVPIKGFELKYFISNYGRVKSLDSEMNNPLTPKGVSIKKGQILNPWMENGYYRVGLVLKGKHKFMFIQRLVALNFIVFENEKPYVNHKDGCPTNNFILNLEWCTQKENVWHSIHVLDRFGFNRKAVIDLNTGFFFDSIIQAKRDLNISRDIVTLRRKVAKNNSNLQYV